MAPPCILWFRQDLRLEDNPALVAALKSGSPVIAVFIWSPGDEGEWSPGAASRWWLHHALNDLAGQLSARGSRLVLRSGCAESVLSELISETSASAVFWNRRYEPLVVERDARIKERLRREGLVVESFNSALLHEPWTVASGSGKAYRVYTPFMKAARSLSRKDPVPLPLADWKNPSSWPTTQSVDQLRLLPGISWDSGFYPSWEPTRSGAQRALANFVDERIAVYAHDRDVPGIVGTSRLSPYLHWGQIGPREVIAAIQEVGVDGPGRETFEKEIYWREFAHHVLFHFPKTIEHPLQAKFADFPWEPDQDFLRAWQRGETGYPMVDAGMRELWQTGWMHNRVRMIVGSLLVKHLLQPWQSGAEWFWDTLVDADLANNTLGWQWIGGCGADAAPYFRIFNPITQGSKFDPEGDYVRRWVPELSKLPSRVIQEPWKASTEILAHCGVRLGRDYPNPIIEHSEGRARALAAFEKVKAED